VATRRELPADFAAALDEHPAARVRFAALSVQRQNEWLAWIDGGRGQGGRAGRIEEAIRRLSAPAEEEIVERVGPPPERAWWVWLLLLLVLVVAGLLLWYFLSRGPGKTTVPNVDGLRSSDAAARLHAAHLKDLPITGTSTKPPGIVFAQRPGAGTQMDKNQTVTISISSGLAGTPVPNVTGLPEAQASTQLTARGFKVQVQRHAGTRPKGLVLAQEPVAGVTAVKGTTVIVSVSSGAQTVAVPSVVGQTQGAAVTQLTKLGLKPELKNVRSAKPVGEVIAQQPAPGAKVDKGSTVALNVSSGTGGTTTVQTTTTTTTTTTPTTTTRTTTTTATTAAGVSLPDVTGHDVSGGVRSLNAAGFHPTVSYASSTQPAGQIVRQRPAGGNAPTGSVVAVTVSNGPSPAEAVTVPDVVGQDQASAGSAIGQAGLKPLVLFRKTTDQTQDGNIIDEQPAAGTSIPGDSYVAIVVGRFSG
jgi:beta-lactam-binding protein with PASTA domain